MKRLAACLTLITLLVAGLNSQAQTAQERDKLTELLGKPLSSRAQSWGCKLDRIFRCSSKHGCSDTHETAMMKLNTATATLTRCTDADGDFVYSDCVNQEATMRVAGIYTIFETTTGSLVKVQNDGTEIIIIGASASNVNNEFGSCLPSNGK